jgi:hypothetical protein
MWRESISGLADCDLHCLTCTELTTRTEAAMQGVFAFLGRDPCPVRGRFVRLRPAAISEKLLNYQDYLQPDILPYTVLARPTATESRQVEAA